MPENFVHLSRHWSRFVTRRWRWVLLIWVALVVVCRTTAPAWQDVAFDGDFEHLPPSSISVQATRFLDDAFPTERPRSQYMILFARNGGKITKTDEFVARDFSRRLRHRLAVVYIQRALSRGWSGQTAPVNAEVRELVNDGLTALDRAIELDEMFYNYFDEVIHVGTDPRYEPRIAIAYWDRAQLHQAMGHPDQSKADREIALALCPTIDQTPPIAERIEPLAPLLDIISWDDKLVGKRLAKSQLRLLILRLESEFLATSNIDFMQALDELIAQVKSFSFPLTEPGLRIEIAGSAALGGETLTAARDAIRYTEWFTIALIMIILAVVYRSPALVAIPLVSIGVAVITATGLVSALASVGQQPGMDWLGLRIFTTSRIFVVVILFGAGTDYCLFLISRLREESANLPWVEAVELALAKVMNALVGSALTTAVGLGMMWVGEFGKFHFTGPIIGICLLVGLLVCTTLTPALLCALGPVTFWPNRLPTSPVTSRFWHSIALLVTRRPQMTLVLGIALLLIPAIYGYAHQDDISYDVTSQLGEHSRSRQGVQLLAKSFSLGQTNPISVLLIHESPVDAETTKRTLRQIVSQLYEVPGVQGVRYLEDPLGDNRPGQRKSFFEYNSVMNWVLKQHRISRRYFTSDQPAYISRLMRLDVIFDHEPFGDQSAEDLDRVRERIHELSNQFSLGISPGATNSLEDVDILVEQIKLRVDQLRSALSDEMPGLDLTMQSNVGAEQIAWYETGNDQSSVVHGEVLVKTNDRQQLIRFAKLLLAAIRQGDAELGIEPIKNANIRLTMSPLADCRMLITGTTVAIEDLKRVTTSDTTRIKVYVVAAVLVILLLVVWRFLLSVYLIATVLLSYFATLGLTLAFFRWSYGDQFEGLDWKLPLFLFVILVAVGQDYNVYLVTRVLEEQQRGGRLAGLVRAITHTGGIITACGVTMAGTFFAMTASAWGPGLLHAVGLSSLSGPTPVALRSIVELGFALGVGVLLDTFYVRTVLVPAYMATFDQRRRKSTNRQRIGR